MGRRDQRKEEGKGKRHEVTGEEAEKKRRTGITGKERGKLEERERNETRMT